MIQTNQCYRHYGSGIVPGGVYRHSWSPCELFLVTEYDIESTAPIVVGRIVLYWRSQYKFLDDPTESMSYDDFIISYPYTVNDDVMPQVKMTLL